MLNQKFNHNRQENIIFLTNCPVQVSVLDALLIKQILRFEGNKNKKSITIKVRIKKVCVV